MKIHEVEHALRHGRRIRVYTFVDYIQPVVQVYEGVAKILHHGRSVRRGVEVYILAAAHQQLTGKIRHIGRGHVRVHAAGQNINDLRRVRDIAKTQELIGRGLKEVVLHVYTVKVAIDITVAEAAQTHGLLSVKQLVARLEVYYRTAVVVQAFRHIEPYPAELVHGLNEGVQIEHRVAVYVKADQLLYMAAQRLAAVITVVARAPVDAVDLSDRRVHIYERVPRYAHDVECVTHHIQFCHHYRVGIAGTVVVADQKHCIYPVLTLGVKGCALIHGLLFFCSRFFRLHRRIL